MSTHLNVELAAEKQPVFKEYFTVLIENSKQMKDLNLEII